MRYDRHRLARGFAGDPIVRFSIMWGWREGWGDDQKIVGVSLYTRRNHTLRTLIWR